MIATLLLLAAIGGRSSWTAPWYDGRGNLDCEVRVSGGVQVELCEAGGKLVDVRCREADGHDPAPCPGWVQTIIWQQKGRE